MRTLRTVAELRAALAQPRRERRRIGLVPTMGAFHGGHLSLMRRAREECDEVVVSLFVNPTQFDEDADLADYPRDEGRDAMLAAEEHVDYLFAPAVPDIYPDGFSTSVSVGGVTEALEGASRGRKHFDGVATVVNKLFHIVVADIAYFGQKDAQQVAMIRRMVRDLDIGVEIEVCPIQREADGLAMSSRNVRLSPQGRLQAPALYRSLNTAASLLAAGESRTTAIRSAALAELDAAGIRTEYFEIVNPETFVPTTSVEGPALAVVAARVGDVRLIDNQPL